MAKERVIVAMSGGVDSAVAAARLVDAGYDVIGVTLHLWDYPEEGAKGSHGRCCAPEDQYDARRMADAIGFPHYTFDRRELFLKEVVEPFVDAYLAGETPAPCTRCNRTVKLKELFSIADRLGAKWLATGHYARIGKTANGEPCILTGVDSSKDQSYFLFATPTALIERLVFPLGESTKTEVRDEAVKRALPGATKGESQELCFVGSGEHAYTAFVEDRGKARVRPGPIVDSDGRVVGAHAGVHRFTVGQRKGIGVAIGKPAFVTKIDAEKNTVWVGDDSELASPGALLDEVVLLPNVELPLELSVRVRYRHEGVSSIVEKQADGRVTLRFATPVRAVTPGQMAVFYEGDRVLGGGRIVSAAAINGEQLV